MSNPATIHLRVPAAIKGRWIRASRAAGMRLGDWITAAVEAQMKQQSRKVSIPDELEFSDLNLARESDGSVSFDWGVIEKICEASGLPIAHFQQGPEENVTGLLIGWYQAHRQNGGAPDPVAEDLFAEAVAEEKAGQPFSHRPGSA